MVKKINGLFDKIGLYILALGVTILNISLAFDNTVWGDEAYSQMAIKGCDLSGVFQRIVYWDTHPPIYYYYLRLFADLFGYKTAVYHIASLFPFVVGMVFACTVLKKYLGALPAALFVIVSGLSESCVEYNLEIRMYSLLFLFVLLCAFCALKVITKEAKTRHVILMTLFGVLAAYTHYYGVALCGLLIFFAGAFSFITFRQKKNIINWAVSTVSYVVLYIPWLIVLYRQTQTELANPWLDKPDELKRIISFIFFGERLHAFAMTVCIVLSIGIIVSELGIVRILRGQEKCSYFITFSKPVFGKLSDELKGILFLWLSGAALLTFGYVASYVFHPIVVKRYTYALIPITLLIFSLCLKKVIESSIKEAVKSMFVWLVLAVVLAFALLDFKDFRSASKTQDYQTKRVLNTIGTPSEDVLFTVNDVQHLNWTVLRYYYENESVNALPNVAISGLSSKPREIWAFSGYKYTEDYLKLMESSGYSSEVYPDMWLGKYYINLYRFILN